MAANLAGVCARMAELRTEEERLSEQRRAVRKELKQVSKVYNALINGPSSS